jgi:cytochrome c5
MRRDRSLAGLLIVAVVGCIIVTSAASARVHAAPQQPSSISSAIPPRPIVEKYCVSCHNQRLKTAGLMLDTADMLSVAKEGAIWEKVVRKLRAGAMPPAGSPRPDAAAYDTLAGYLETELDRAAASKPNPGSLGTFHRLSRTEYTKAIRDLLALDALPKELDIATLLPADNSSTGFDNLADLLFVSPTALDGYAWRSRDPQHVSRGRRISPEGGVCRKRTRTAST